MPSGAAHNLIEVLTPIWKRTLQRPTIDVHDNFFDLGGDPWIAVKLFREIAEATDRDLAPMLIYAAPTVDQLSAVLGCSAQPRFPTHGIVEKWNSGNTCLLPSWAGWKHNGIFPALKAPPGTSSGLWTSGAGLRWITGTLLPH